MTKKPNLGLKELNSKTSPAKLLEGECALAPNSQNAGRLGSNKCKPDLLLGNK